MKKFALLFLMLSGALLLPSACAPVADTACDSLDGFTAALRAESAEVEVAEQVEQPFFAVPAQRLVVNGEDVQVLAYASEDAARQDASQISPDGYTIGTAMVDWIGTPHFFQCGQMLVIYIGDSTKQLSLLEGILGPQFAGG